MVAGTLDLRQDAQAFPIVGDYVSTVDDLFPLQPEAPPAPWGQGAWGKSNLPQPKSEWGQGVWGKVTFRRTPPMLAYEDVGFDIEPDTTGSVHNDIFNRTQNYLTMSGGYQIRANAQIRIPVSNLYTFDCGTGSGWISGAANSITDTMYLGTGIGTTLAQGQTMALAGINVANGSANQVTIQNLRIQNNQVVFTIHTNAGTVGNTFGQITFGSGNFGNFVISTGSSYGRWMSKEEMLRERIKQQLNPPIYVTRDGKKVLVKDKDLWDVQQTPEENRARGLLREMVGDMAFRRYLQRGFLMVKGGSGVMYKIYGGTASSRNRGLIESYIKNPATGTFTPFEAFCIQFKDAGLPHTDGVIMRKLLVENDEFGMRKLANVRAINPNNQTAEFDKQGDLIIRGTPYRIAQRVAG